jgi:hypothetical protein
VTGNLYLDLGLTVAAAVAGWLMRHFSGPSTPPPSNNAPTKFSD